MANTVKLKRSAVQGNAPSTTDLALGELGLNTYDGKLFMKKDDGTEAIVEIGAGGTDGERDFIASGTIANGNRVVLNADGTVSTITGPASTQEVGTAAQFATSAVGVGSAYDSVNQKVVVVYPNGGSSQRPTAVVGTVSGTSISFGTPVQLDTNSCWDVRAVYDVASGKVVVIYRDSGDSFKGKAFVGTVSGTSISFGSKVTYSASDLSCHSIVYDETNEKVVIAFDGGTNSSGRAVVGTVSGTSISFGSEVSLTGENKDANFIVAAYDSTNGKIVVAYEDDGNSGDYGKAVVGTVSGTSISFGTPVTFESAQTKQIAITFDSFQDKVVISYRDNGNSKYGTAIVGTVSGTSISFGTPVVFENTHEVSMTSMCFDSDENKVIIAYRAYSGSAEQGGYVIAGEVSGTSISFGSSLQFESTAVGTYGTSLSYDSANRRSVISYRNGTPGPGKSVVYKSAGGGKELTSTNYIGLAAESIAHQATGKITVTGGINESQSGLTVAESYYVQSDGSLSTTAGTPAVFAGTALSSTKILANIPEASSNSELVLDTSPQLGGDLDMNSNSISSGVLGVKNEGTQSEIRLYCESGNAHYAAIKAPLHSDFSGNIAFTMPGVDGTANQVLKTDGSGNLGWVSQSSGGGGSGGGAASSVSNDTGHLYIVNATGNDDSNIYIQAVSGENSIVCNDDSGVELYYNASWRLTTSSTGFTVNGTGLGNFKANDSQYLTVGTGDDFQIYHDETNTYLDNNTGHIYIRNNVNDDDGGNIYIQAKSGENSIACNDDSSVSLYYDDSWRFATSSSGFTVNGTGLGNFKADDNQYLTVGADNDFQVYHDATNTYLDNDTGSIYIRNNVAGDVGGNIYIQAKSGEDSIVCYDDASVVLYYDGSWRFKTTSSGVEIPGTLTVGVLNFPDGNQLTFGDSNDLQIYHDGGDGSETNDTFIDNNVGSIYIRNNVDGDVNADIYIQARSGENSIACYDDSSVALYYDGSWKFQTSTSGFTVNGTGLGNFKAGDNQYLTAGTGDDFQIYHNETNTYLDNDTGSVYIRNNVSTDVGGDIYIQAKSGEHSITCNDDSSVALYYDGSWRLQTSSSGFTVNGTGLGNFKANDNNYLTAGTGDDFQIYHDETNTYLDNDTGHIYIRNNVAADVGGNIYIQAKSGENSITCNDDSSVALYYDNVAKLQTTTSGVAVNGNLDMSADNYKILLGTDDDFEVYHDGTNTYLDNDTGDVYIRNNVAADVSGDIHIQAKSGEESIVCNDDSSVQLYYNNVLKLNTSTSGVNVTGTVSATGLDLSGMLSEGANITAGKLSANTNIDLEDGMVHLFTTTETTTSTPNIRFSSSSSLNSSMSIGDAVTVALISKTAAAGYSAQLQIDGTNVTEEWLGGSAPSAGGSGGYDVYTYNIIKTADASFLVLANLVNFA